MQQKIISLHEKTIRVQRKTLLLIEDELITAIHTKKQLEKYGYNVITVHTGEAAIETIRTDRSIDCILSDIDLGNDMDGPTAAEMILQEHDLPLLFLSSHTDKAIVERTERITNYGYVVKNSDITVLDASIKMAFKLFDAKLKEQEKEDALIEKTRLLQHITDNMFDVVALTDMQGFIKIISRSNNVLGYDVEHLKGKNIFHYVHPDDRQRILNSFQKALATRTDGERVELRLRAQDGSYIWFETFGKYLPREHKGKTRELLFSSRNITDRKKAEEALKASEEKYRQLVENINDVVFSTDLNGIFTYISPVIEVLSGYTEGELLGSSFKDFIHPEDLPELAKQLEQTLSEVYASHDFRVFDRAGELHYVRTSSKANKEDGAITGLTGLMIDITERKRTELALQNALDKNKILLQELQHRTKNYLNNILGFIDLMSDNEPVNELIPGFLPTLKSRITAIFAIYDMLYRSSDLKHIEISSYLQELSSSVITYFNHTAKNIRLNTDLDTVQLDYKLTNLLGQITNEILTNSMKYAFPHDAPGEITIALKVVNKTVTLQISDNGIGLPPNFDINTSAGLGSMLISGLISQIGGTLRIENARPGTAFMINFDLTDDTIRTDSPL